MLSPSNPIHGPRILPHERMQIYNLGAHTLEVIKEPTDPTARTIRITAAPDSDPDAPDTMTEDVCLSWEEAYKLLIMLRTLFQQD
jgi:hypothetical protein